MEKSREYELFIYNFIWTWFLVRARLKRRLPLFHPFPFPIASPSLDLSFSHTFDSCRNFIDAFHESIACKMRFNTECILNKPHRVLRILLIAHAHLSVNAFFIFVIVGSLHFPEWTIWSLSSSELCGCGSYSFIQYFAYADIKPGELLCGAPNTFHPWLIVSIGKFSFYIR